MAKTVDLQPEDEPFGVALAINDAREVVGWYQAPLPDGAGHFNYVEVNATFYALPVARTVERWCIETPDDFVFDVKLPKVD